jgi:histidine triad (HIT) family protein
MSECIFCQIVKGEAQAWKVHEDETVLAFLDTRPVSAYHTLVIPKRHYENIYDIPEKELGDVMRVVKKLAVLYNRKLGIENVQIVNSNGAEAQQHVFHIHFHIVPRKLGDGQNIRWTAHPEWVENFDRLLEKLA